jgi:hypothetical protein
MPPMWWYWHGIDGNKKKKFFSMSTHVKIIERQNVHGIIYNTDPTLQRTTCVRRC